MFRRYTNLEMVQVVKYFDWKIHWQAESSQVLAVLASDHSKDN